MVVGRPSTWAGVPESIREAPPACPDCRGDMLERAGKFGPFWGCAEYPACKGTVEVALRRSQTGCVAFRTGRPSG